MNVTFGQFKQHTEITPNNKQHQALYKIAERLNPDSTELIRHKYSGGNLTNLLENQKDADIDVTLRRNGMIDISVTRTSGVEDINGRPLYSFIPYSVTGIGKLTTTINPMSQPDIISRKLNEFANKCYWYAKEAQSRRNNLLEQGLESKIEECYHNN